MRAQQPASRQDLPAPSPQGIEIRPVETERLRECEQVFRETLGPRFGFEEVDVVPGWLMLTSVLNGGLVLGAFAGDDLAGFSYAFPGYGQGELYLFSSGLMVRPRYESSGIGRTLKLAQRDHALASGYRLIRWTTGSLASKPLRLYLRRLGAVLVGISADLFAPFRPNSVADEVSIEWDLTRFDADAEGGHSQADDPETIGRVTTRTRLADPDVRILTEILLPDKPAEPRYAVELPWDLALLEQRLPGEVRTWRLAVREVISDLLDLGYVGVDVALHRECKRSYLVLARRPQVVGER